MFKLDSDVKQILAVSAAALLLLIIASVYIGGQNRFESGFSSENMTGGVPLLSEGDELSYTAEAGGNRTNITVVAKGRDVQKGCVLLEQRYREYVTSVCYSEVNGSEAYILMNGTPVGQGEFATLPAIHAFEPWMIGASVGWSGRVTMSANMGASGILGAFEVTYRCTWIGNVSGRRALRVDSEIFAVRGSGLGNAMEKSAIGRRTVWVDLEKRVMLKEESSVWGINSSQLLSRAPFPLNLTG